jgi:hypothetical protein
MAYLSLQISHTPFTLSNLSSLNLVSLFRCSSPVCHPVYVYPRRVDPSSLSFSLSIYTDTQLIYIKTSFHSPHILKPLVSISSGIHFPSSPQCVTMEHIRYSSRYTQSRNQHSFCTTTEVGISVVKGRRTKQQRKDQLFLPIE